MKFDKNSLLGVLLIGAIFIAYLIYSSPSEEEQKERRRVADSLAKVRQEQEAQKQTEDTTKKASAPESQAPDSLSISEFEDYKDSTLTDSAQQALIDSVKQATLQQEFGLLNARAGEGENRLITLENEKIKITFSSKGGRPYSVQLKEYVKSDSSDLILFDGDSTRFGLIFHEIQSLRPIKVNTNELYFDPSTDRKQIDASGSEQSISFRLKVDDRRYIEYVYSLAPDSYLMDFDIRFVGMQDLIVHEGMELDWYVHVPALEKGREWEIDHTSIYYKFKDDEVDNLSETGEEELEKLETRVRWIAFKQQFFSSILIADDYMESGAVEYVETEDKNYLKNFSARMNLPYTGSAEQELGFTFYFGPNKYSILTDIMDEDNEELELDALIPLGYPFIHWINRLAVIPLFNLLEPIGNYGLIILLMTIIIKLVLFPLTYKSYMSSAKMRVLKPQIDAINEKIPKEKAMERQQAVMGLYRKAGVNPMGGCIPILIQFPILIAMFRFFPASIELRQKSFLWASDLSTYDAIVSLPFEIPWYGDHISLFCLLMAASMLLTTHLNSGQMNQSSSQMPGMKIMMYLMPVMMLFWFNNYSAGLSYYYLVSNLITASQMMIIRRFVDDEAVLKKLEEHKKKPKKKSGFQQRLEEAAKQRGYQTPKKRK